MASDFTKPDGSMDWSGGVDSDRATTIQSNLNPNGLPRNMLSWLVNATVRGGGITQRTGWLDVYGILQNPGLYQGGMLYEPEEGNPYLLALVSGHLLLMPIDPMGPIVDLSATFGIYHPAAERQAYFVQGERFAVIQAGDYATLPMIWDGAVLRSSNGLTGVPAELPAAGPMDYYMGRIWYAQGRSYGAGDIVGGASGTAPYDNTDSILRVTENPLCIGGDNFVVPTNAGNIRAVFHGANLNTQLGQGTLYVGTRKAIYGLQVPVNRTDWINADINAGPLQFAVQINNGPVNDRSIVKVNGDVFYQSLEPSIRSLTAAVRNFQQWGDTPISSNEDRILAFVDRALLYASSGINVSNRVLQTSLPLMTPNGVVHQALVPLNFDTISSLAQKLPPVWEGMWDGLDILQLFTGDFGGRDRAFALIISRIDGSLRLWELTDYSIVENDGNRVTWIIEFPAFTWGHEFEMKKAVMAEIWVDKVQGQVVFTLEYRPDSDPCWYPWHTWEICSGRTDPATVIQPNPYPPPSCGPGYKTTMTIPVPPRICNANTGRPANHAYQVQPRLTIKGFCRIRGFLLHAEPLDRKLYASIPPC